MNALLTFAYRLCLAGGMVIAGHEQDGTAFGLFAVATAIMWTADR